MAYSEILPDPLIFKIYDSFGRELKQLYQWDIDAEIRIKEWNWELGTDEELRCFFSHKNSTESEVIEPTFITEEDDTITLVSKIPNNLLRRDNDINFFVGVVKETEKVKEDSEETEIVTILRQTIFSRPISVTSRGKPKDYTYSDNTDYISVKVLEQEVEDLVEYIHTEIESGDLRGPEGPQGPEGPVGPQGPQGPKGDPGQSGTADYRELTNLPRTLFTPQKSTYHISEIESGIYEITGQFELILKHGDIPEEDAKITVGSGAILVFSQNGHDYWFTLLGAIDSNEQPYACIFRRIYDTSGYYFTQLEDIPETFGWLERYIEEELVHISQNPEDKGKFLGINEIGYVEPMSIEGGDSVVNVYFTKENDEWVCDKSNLELIEAIEDGKVIQAHHANKISTKVVYNSNNNVVRIFFDTVGPMNTMTSLCFEVNANGTTLNTIAHSVDSSMRDDSTNPVRNNVIKAYVDAAVQPQKINLTDNTTIILQDNTEYRGTNISQISFLYPNEDFECFIRLNLATLGTITISLPNTSKYIGAVPVFSNGETWELSIKDGIVVAGKVS